MKQEHNTESQSYLAFLESSFGETASLLYEGLHEQLPQEFYF